MIQKYEEKMYTYAANSNVSSLLLKPEGVNLWYLQVWLSHLFEFVGLRLQISLLLDWGKRKIREQLLDWALQTTLMYSGKKKYIYNIQMFF